MYFLLMLILSMAGKDGFGQKESYNWYFGNQVAMKFHSGSPVTHTGSQMVAVSGCASISDSMGNLLFYSNGIDVWNRNNQKMPNGTGLYGAQNQNCSQSALIVPFPGSSYMFYLFTVDGRQPLPSPYYGLRYSLVNMNLDGSLGDVTLKNQPVPYGDKAFGRLTAVRHANNKDIWVITRLYNDDRYISYQVTESGINPNPVLSPTGRYIPISNIFEGYIKISGDSRHLICINDDVNKNERCLFNSSTGTIEFLFEFENGGRPVGAEMSSDGTYLYISPDVSSQKLRQFDLSKMDKTSFQESVVEIGDGTSGALQIAPDGKIYGCQVGTSFLSVINSPDSAGLSCNYQKNAIQTVSGEVMFGLPQFIQSYFLRFDYTGTCAGLPFAFTPNFNPIPDSIHWNFGDPGSGINDTTTQLSPVHVFAQGGSYTVTVFVRYPDGRTEQTSRVVTVSGLPTPNLGPDSTVCKGTSVTLNPGSFASYTWNNGTLGQTITVADTGQYWVEVVNDTGCINRDTLQLQWFAQPTLDETNLTVSPTTCNASTGAITGIQVNALQPYTLTWKNGSGAILGTTPDLYHLPVDNYTLWVSDSAGCNTPVKTYTIHNVGDTLILSVDNSAAHCLLNGIIKINATSGLTDMLQYSLNGTDWFSNGGLFSQVAPGSYQVWVKDSLGCKKVYDGNPVVISNIPGPVVQPPTVLPETGGQSNGSISITATSAGDTIWYSINGGIPQPNRRIVQRPVSRKLFTHSS